MNQKWKKMKKAIAIALGALTLLGVAGSFWKFGAVGSFVTLVTVLCLALGFVVTELLVGILTGVKKANPTAIALLLLGKIGWWAGLFGLSRAHPPGTEYPIVIGMAVFLLALVAGVLAQNGWPKISDA